MDPDWSRYGCQLALPGFGAAGQNKLSNARVLVAGAGGLGCPAALYLAAAGIGHLTIVDHDVVSESNLHRQILYGPADIGHAKADVAFTRLQALNPNITVLPIAKKLSPSNVLAIIEAQDLVIDCTDNFETKYLLNDACVLAGVPLLYGAVYQFEGQLALLNLSNNNGSRSPNYRDIFPSANSSAIPDCAEGGVLPTVAGMIGCMQANEAIKWIAGVSKTPAGTLLIIDGATLQTQTIAIGDVTRTNITSLPDAEHIGNISVVELRNNIGAYELVDVRSSSEREQGHFDGLHIQLDELADHSDKLCTFTKPVIFYCQSGKRSFEAARIMTRRFPNKIWQSLEGGWEAWTLYQRKK